MAVQSKTNRKAVDHEGRQARILDAADAVFGEQGFDGASARDVAERAGVNKALIFYYFRSKDGLFEKVLERYYDAHAIALQHAFSGGGSVAERLHRLIDAYVDYIDANRRWPRLVQGQVCGSGGHLELIARNLAPMYSWVEAALGEVAPASGPLAARQFFLTFSGAVINYFTYAPVLAELWPEDPVSAEAVQERRAHLHWLIDVILAELGRTGD
ncbi:MAG: TetR/AcrR family transcriptional regulator [Myxococcales bacterium]|nr:TetR/AcrR family transcriptional regulator [Myxococcales bacterium]